MENLCYHGYWFTLRHNENHLIVVIKYKSSSVSIITWSDKNSLEVDKNFPKINGLSFVSSHLSPSVKTAAVPKDAGIIPHPLVVSNIVNIITFLPFLINLIID